MLIQFTIENYGPIAEQATLSMMPVPAFKKNPDCLFATKTTHTPKLLRSALIYGANASGKSTLIKAMGFVQDLVLDTCPLGTSLSAEPFLLDPETAKAACGFEVVFIAGENHQRYQYGFTILANKIEKEWLYEGHGGVVRTLFYREWHEGNQCYTWSLHELDKEIEDFNQDWLNKIQRNQLIFSLMAETTHRNILHDVYEWFQDKLVVIGQGKSFDRALSAQLCNTPATKEWVLDWMRRADFAVTDVEIKSNINYEMSEIATAGKVADKKTQLSPALCRVRSRDKETIKIPFEMESDGTKKWFEWAGTWKRYLEGGQVILWDEIETHMHHHLTQYLLDILNSPVNNPKGTQLLASTHDVALLSLERIRRDQVWILEKTIQQSAVLTALAEYKLSEDEPWLEGYLMGRFGGIPIIRRHGPIGQPL